MSRKLEPGELALILDWPVTVIKQMGAGLTWDLAQDTRVPFKLRQYVGDYVARVLGADGHREESPNGGCNRDAGDNSRQELLEDLPDLDEEDDPVGLLRIETGDEADRIAKAVKADDAEIPTSIWDAKTGLFSKSQKVQEVITYRAACDALRQVMWRVWLNNVRKSYFRYREEELKRRELKELPGEELEAARSALAYASALDWWQ